MALVVTDYLEPKVRPKTRGDGSSSSAEVQLPRAREGAGLKGWFGTERRARTHAWQR